MVNLTRVALKQINNERDDIDYNSNNNNTNDEGPLWNYFWNSLSSNQSNEPMNLTENNISPHPSNSLLKLSTDIHPEESVSMTCHHKKRKEEERQRDFPSSHHINSGEYFTFKFTCHKHRTYRILCRPNLMDLMDAIRAKVNDDFSVVAYLDDEEDQVFISGDTDLEDAVYQAIKLDQTCVKLIVKNLVKTDTFQTDEIERIALLSPSSSSSLVSPPSSSPLSSSSSFTSSFFLTTAISILGIAVTAVFICSKTSNQ